MVEIDTGNAEWDNVLWLSQVNALGALVGPTDELQHPSIVQVRTPDRGYSEDPQGRDHTRGWDGQSVFDTYLVALQLLSAAPEMAAELLAGFLATQSPDGWIDARPSLSGKASGRLCPPLLSSLALRIYQHTQEREFLSTAYPKLAAFAGAWFGKPNDFDLDGFPEWAGTDQAGRENSPSYGSWESWMLAQDISTAETPDMAAFLIHELYALDQIAAILDRADDAEEWEERRREILDRWHGLMGEWPPVVEDPDVEILPCKSKHGFMGLAHESF